MPTLSQIPFVGQILFQQDISVYIDIILLSVVGVVLYHTALGLKIIAAGENSRAQALPESGARFYLTMK